MKKINFITPVAIVVSVVLIGTVVLVAHISNLELAKTTVRNQAIQECLEYAKFLYTTKDGSYQEIKSDVYSECLTDKGINTDFQAR